MNFSYSKIFGIKGLQWLRDVKVTGNDQILLHEYIQQIEFLTREIKNIESKIRIDASNNESVKILMSMTGINYFSAMMISLKLAILADLVHLKNLYHGLDYDVHQYINLETHCIWEG